MCYRPRLPAKIMLVGMSTRLRAGIVSHILTAVGIGLGQEQGLSSSQGRSVPNARMSSCMLDPMGHNPLQNITTTGGNECPTEPMQAAQRNHSKAGGQSQPGKARGKARGPGDTKRGCR
jgi:hypothetical protein